MLAGGELNLGKQEISRCPVERANHDLRDQCVGDTREVGGNAAHVSFISYGHPSPSGDGKQCLKHLVYDTDESRPGLVLSLVGEHIDRFFIQRDTGNGKHLRLEALSDES